MESEIKHQVQTDADVTAEPVPPDENLRRVRGLRRKIFSLFSHTVHPVRVYSVECADEMYTDYSLVYRCF